MPWPHGWPVQDQPAMPSNLQPRPGGGAHVRGCGAEAAAKGPVEVGQIVEADLECDGADALVSPVRAGQHAMGARQALAEQEFRERAALQFEQHLDVARRYALASRNGIDAETGVVEIPGDVGFDCLQTRGPYPPAMGDFGGLARRAEREGQQVIDMGNGKLVEPGCLQRPSSCRKSR